MATLTTTNRPHPISDLAAGLTDQTLAILRRAGIRGDSVEMEIEAWHALTDEIHQEFDVPAPPSGDDSFRLCTMIRRAVHRAALRVADQVQPAPMA